MKGNNDFYINDATMIEALEYWLNTTQFKQPIKVIAVAKDGSMFRIELATDERPDSEIRP